MSFGKKEINGMEMNENNNFKIFLFSLLGVVQVFDYFYFYF